MEDKTFELLEKMYAEFISFKQETNSFRQETNNFRQEFSSFRQEINHKVDKNTLLLERMEDKIQILAEVQQNHLEINERQHDEMNERNTEQLDLLKSALQHIVRNI